MGGITCGWFKASTEGPGVYTPRIKEETLSKHYEFQPLKPSEQAAVVTDAGSLYGKGQRQFLRWKGLRAEARACEEPSPESLWEKKE